MEGYRGWYRWDDATRKWIPHPDPEAGPTLTELEMRPPPYARRRTAEKPT